MTTEPTPLDDVTPPGPRTGRGLPRWLAAAIGSIVVVAVLLWGWGVFAADSAIAVNGAVIAVAWGIDTVRDVAVVGLWLASACGFGRNAVRMLLPPGTTFVGESRAVAAASSPASEFAHFGRATVAAVGIGIVGFLALAVGLIGQLNRGTAGAILLGGVALLPWRRLAGVRPWLRARSRSAVFAWPLAVPLAVMTLAATVPPGVLWKPLDPHPYDVVSYHLQIPRQWFEAGRITALPDNAFSYFPAGQEVHSLLLMHLTGGPWAAQFVAQFVSVAFAVLTAMAVVGAVRGFGGGVTRTWAAGLLTLCVPWTLMLGGVAYVECAVMLYATLAAVWAMRALEPVVAPTDFFHAMAGAVGSSANDSAQHAIRSAAAAAASWRSRAMFAAGVCCGLAGGVKYTALAMTTVPLLALWPVLARRGGAVVRPTLLAALACGLVMSPWLARNAVWAGNPVFPLASGLFGHGPFTTEQVERFDAAHRPPPAERGVGPRLANAWSRVAADPQYAYGLLPLTLVASALALRSPRGRFAVGLLVAAGGVWAFGTHEQPRFLTPVIPLAAMVIGGVGGPLAVRIGLSAIGVAVAVFGLVWTTGTLSPTLDLARGGLFRMNDMSQILSPDAADVLQHGGKLALVGDAQAYRYPFPAGRLRYRGVFDVNVPPGTSLVDGWLGESVEKLRAEGWTVLIDPAELCRLAKTYRNLPAPVAPYDDPAGRPVVLPPTR